MVLKTKSILAATSIDDGLRICVMREYNPGKHPEYMPIDEHWDALPPSKELLKDYHNNLPWEDYVKRFTSEVLLNQAEKVKELANKAMKDDITILCYEDKPDKCHRRLVALACQMYEPYLKLVLE